MPESGISPVMSLLRRLAIALGALVVTALIVFFGRDGYLDNNSDTPISLADAFYYATVSVSTTGYGDIVPVSDTARLITTIFVTPLEVDLPHHVRRDHGGAAHRVVPAVVPDPALEEPRAQPRHRRRVRNQGTGAVETLLGDGTEPTDIVVVDTDRSQLDAASALGLVTVPATSLSPACCGWPACNEPTRSWSRRTGTTPRCWSR